MLTPRPGTEVQQLRLGESPRRVHQAGGRTLEVLGGAVGAGIGVAISFAIFEHDIFEATAFKGWTHTVLGVAAGTALLDIGVYAGGRATGGRGAFGITVLGSLVGIAAGGLVAVTVSRLDVSDPVFFTGIAFIPGLAVAGAVVGYELSDARARRRGGAELRPTLSVRRDGGSMGLVGRW